MYRVLLACPDDFEGWRDTVRALVQARVPPEQVIWQVGDAPADLFGDEAILPPTAPAAFRVSRAFLELAQTVVLLAVTSLMRNKKPGHAVSKMEAFDAGLG